MAFVKDSRRYKWLYLTLAVTCLAALSCRGRAVNGQQAGSEKPRDAHNPALVAAVRRDDLAEVRRLLQQGADPNSVDENGHTLLQNLSSKNPIPMLELLYEFKADLNLAGGRWPGPLEAAVYLASNNQKAGQQMVTWLLQHGANAKAPTVLYPLLSHALSADSSALVEELLAAGADPNARGPNNRTPLRDAVLEDDAMVGLLLAHGANPNIYDDRGWSALLDAVERNDARKVKLLLQHGADVNHGDRDGWTAYDQALLQGCPVIVAELEKAGAVQ